MQEQMYNTPAIALRQATWRRSAGPRFGILQDLASKLLWEIRTIQQPEDDVILLGDGFKLEEQLRRIEMDLIRHALTITGGRQTDAAALLGIKPTTLNVKIKRLGIKISEISFSRRSTEPAR